MQASLSSLWNSRLQWSNCFIFYRKYKTKNEYRETHTDPVEVQDELGGSTCFSIYVDTGLSDNPMQSEICSQIGGKGNCFCRKCKVGGTQKDKATNDGYHTLFEVSAHSEFKIHH
jgi:hypothetical protein